MVNDQIGEIHVLPPLVINWHITEACNYSCKFCYAKWQAEHETRELIHNPARSRQLLEALYALFGPQAPDNPLSGRMAYRGLRLTLAGGEPFLYPRSCLDLINVARGIGFEISVITNASRLGIAEMRELAPNLSILGISVDSVNESTNLAIGRNDRKGVSLSLGDLKEKIAAARSANPKISLKINTVVNIHNWQEDFSDAIGQLCPDRWKVLRVLPARTDAFVIQQAEFDAFVARHRAYRNIMSVEDNADMTQSYLMIDPHGCFFQNRVGRPGYDYSAPILEVGAAQAFKQIIFSPSGFLSRYPSVELLEVA